MTEELKACPCCNGTKGIPKVEEMLPEWPTKWRVICYPCLYFVGAETEADAIKKWNDRPRETAAYVKGLQRAVEIVEESTRDWLPGTGLFIRRHELLSAIEAAIQEAQNGTNI